jgi:beta-ketoacyl-acyl-carrier-protein synthase II
MKRVVITGLGLISPLGNSTTRAFAAACAGHSGIRRLDDNFCPRLTTRIAAQVDFAGGQHFDAPRLRMLDRSSQFALAAVRQALTDARLDLADTDPSRNGVFLGTGMGGAQSTDEAYSTLYGEQSDRLKPFSVLLAMNNAAAAWVGIDYRITGPTLTFTTACSSSAVAIGEAARRIQAGEVDIMIAGGTEAPLSLGPMKAWEALRTLATEDPIDPGASCKPFSKNRTGMVLGEGAAILVLEELDRALKRQAPVYGELIGYGLSTDAQHLTRPSIDGQARAMRLALESSGLPASSIGYLNAHGTGTLANDFVETAAIKAVFGPCAARLPISSTKGMHGHLLGASAALEFAIALLAMGANIIPPTINLDEPDPECDLDYVPGRARADCDINAVMSNSFAFGGTNAVLIAKRMTDPR